MNKETVIIGMQVIPEFSFSIIIASVAIGVTVAVCDLQGLKSNREYIESRFTTLR